MRLGSVFFFDGAILTLSCREFLREVTYWVINTRRSRGITRAEGHDIPSCKHTSHKRFGVLDFMMKFQNAAMLHYNPLSLTWPFLNLRSRSTSQFFLTCCLFNKVITRTNRESNTHDVLVQWEFVFKQASSWCHYSDITRPRVHQTKRSHDKVSRQ